jgi:hypothetical protein
LKRSFSEVLKAVVKWMLYANRDYELILPRKVLKRIFKIQEILDQERESCQVRKFWKKVEKYKYHLRVSQINNFTSVITSVIHNIGN